MNTSYTCIKTIFDANFDNEKIQACQTDRFNQSLSHDVANINYENKILKSIKRIDAEKN